MDPNSYKCEACGHYHGGVNVRISCLSKKLEEQRREIQLLRAMLGRQEGENA